MHIREISLSSIKDLKAHILSRAPSIFTSSKTSTVIPYEKIKDFYADKDESFELSLVDISALPQKMELLENGNLSFWGGVTFEEARLFLREKKRDLCVFPTEELASLVGGISTSATGERSFSFGPLRQQVKEVYLMNSNAEILTLRDEVNLSDYFSQEQLTDDLSLLTAYQKAFKPFNSFKNGPFPHFEKATHLAIGTEGQLGVVLGGVLETIPLKKTFCLAIELPRWEEDNSLHLAIYERLQSKRDFVYCLEFIDWSSFEVSAFCLPGQKKETDFIFIEVLEEYYEDLFTKDLSTIEGINLERIMELKKSDFDKWRKEVPRLVWEKNSKRGIIKKGTDIQMPRGHLEKLFSFYREAKELGVESILFGHLGDAHLHFNFLPKDRKEEEICEKFLMALYQKVKQWNGSPFAEHGVGLIKQKYMSSFYTQTQRNFFSFLKKTFDPHAQFFPKGPMNL